MVGLYLLPGVLHTNDHSKVGLGFTYYSAFILKSVVSSSKITLKPTFKGILNGKQFQGRQGPAGILFKIHQNENQIFDLDKKIYLRYDFYKIH